MMCKQNTTTVCPRHDKIEDANANGANLRRRSSFAAFISKLNPVRRSHSLPVSVSKDDGPVEDVEQAGAGPGRHDSTSPRNENNSFDRGARSSKRRWWSKLFVSLFLKNKKIFSSKNGHVMLFMISLSIFMVTRAILKCESISARFLQNNILFAPPPNYVSHTEDALFGGIRISDLSYDQVRKTYNIEQEMKRPMHVVRLPEDFQGEYRPRSLEEFQRLANALIDPVIHVYSSPASKAQAKKAKYGIVTICVEMDICSIAERNQRAYAEKHGYDYLFLSTIVRGVPHKMVKYLVLAWALGRGYDWLLMLDADALITNTEITLTEIIDGQLSSTNKESDDTTSTTSISMLMTRGGNWKNVHAINNGVFFLKNTPWSIQHIYEIFTARYSYTRFIGKTLIDQPLQLSVLLANDELEWPPTKEEEVGKHGHVRIVNKRLFNSFQRDDTYSIEDELEGGSWESGDFLAHFASKKKYLLMIKLLQEENLPGLPPIEQRYDFPLPAQGSHDQYDDTTPAGTCWCSDDGQIKCIPKYHVISTSSGSSFGSRSVMRYLTEHPELNHSPHAGRDRVRWLMDSPMPNKGNMCLLRRKESEQAMEKYNGHDEPIYIPNNGVDSAYTGASTCSFNDYVLLHGKEYGTNQGWCLDGQLPPANNQYHNKPTFDELSIFDAGLINVRGIQLPELLHHLQPSAKLIIPLHDPVTSTYSSYNNSPSDNRVMVDFDHNNAIVNTQKGSTHFHQIMQSLTQIWTERQCTVVNYKTCLPPDLTFAGKWLARSMYGEHLLSWLDTFGCSNVHVFDSSSAQLFEEVQRLYDFVGAPDVGVTYDVTTTADTLTATTAVTSTIGEGEDKMMMQDETKALLEAFYLSNFQVCDIIERHSCLQTPLFERICNK